MRAAIRILLVTFGLFLPIALSAISVPSVGATPDVRIGVSVDLATADPAKLLTYSIWVRNRGPGVAPALWVNDTVPTGATYVDDTAAKDIGAPTYLGKSFAGNTVQFQFANYPVSNLSFSVRAQVIVGVADRQVLQDVARLWYTNSTGAPQPTASASASTTIWIPVVSVTKSGTFTAPDAMTYSITIANSGSASSRNLWWNDSLPAGVQYNGIQSLQGAVCSTSGRRVECAMVNAYPVGSRTWNLMATIPTPLPTGQVITNWVFVNYTDSDRTYLGEVRGSAPLTISTANIHVSVLADAARVAPSGTIGYTIFYNNTGPFAARNVWINDTLPQNASLPAVEIVTATPAPAIQTQSLVRWQFSDVPGGDHFVSLIVRVLASFGDGTILTNAVALNYTDANGVPMPGSRGIAATMVSLNLPAIAAELVANKATVEPGGSIGFTLYYNNTRPALAATVIVQLILPSGLPLSSANPVYTSVAGGKFIWNITGVRSGEHRIDVIAAVPTEVALGTVLRTTAFANYTDAQGNRVGGSQTSADVTVHLYAAAPAFPVVPAAAALLAVVVIGFVVGRLYLARVGETVIDEVFLLHRDGLLIKHYTRRLKPDVDSDILSGMLIAVQNFVNESFIGEVGLKKEGQLDEMKFGEYRILICRGEYVIAAAVVSGARVERVPGQIRAAIAGLEKELAGVLAKWDGNMDQVADADGYMQDLIAGKYRNASRFARGKH